MSGNAVALTIVIVMFVIVTGVGFAAARWRRAEDKLHLNEWGLGGRDFGTFITWFLLGGDLYTAYTFIAVPALIFGVGAVRFLRRPLHDHRLPDRVRVRAPAVVGVPRRTATSRRRTSSAAGTAPAGWRWRWR